MPDPLLEAIRSGDLRTLRQAAAAHPQAARQARCVVEAGCRAFQPALALLVKHGAEINASWKNYRPLHSLIQEEPPAAASPTPERLACLDWLLEHGADPTAAFSHPVWAAACPMAEMALEHGAVPDHATADGKPLLNDLIRWGQIPQTLWLLDRGASPNIADERGWTAVHPAASRGNLRLLDAVLEAGGDPLLRDLEGRTPLDIAILAGREKLIARLAG